jgi:hypothetical protein
MLIDNSSVPVEYRCSCCQRFLDWRDKLLLIPAQSHPDLKDFVKEHRKKVDVSMFSGEDHD